MRWLRMAVPALVLLLPQVAATVEPEDQAALRAAWYTLDENTLHRVSGGGGEPRIGLGSELIHGLAVLGSGRYVVEPFR